VRPAARDDCAVGADAAAFQGLYDAGPRSGHDTIWNVPRRFTSIAPRERSSTEPLAGFLAATLPLERVRHCRARRARADARQSTEPRRGVRPRRTKRCWRGLHGPRRRGGLMLSFRGRNRLGSPRSQDRARRLARQAGAPIAVIALVAAIAAVPLWSWRRSPVDGYDQAARRYRFGRAPHVRTRHGEHDRGFPLTGGRLGAFTWATGVHSPRCACITATARILQLVAEGGLRTGASALCLSLFFGPNGGAMRDGAIPCGRRRVRPRACVNGLVDFNFTSRTHPRGRSWRHPLRREWNEPS